VKVHERPTPGQGLKMRKSERSGECTLQAPPPSPPNVDTSWTPTLIRQLWTNDIFFLVANQAILFTFQNFNTRRNKSLPNFQPKKWWVMTIIHTPPTYHSTQATIIPFLHRERERDIYIYIYIHIVQLPPDKTWVQLQLGWLVEGRMHIYLFDQNLTPKSIRQCLISTSFKSSREKIPPNQQNDWKNV
jgi:hypothetical protein